MMSNEQGLTIIEIMIALTIITIMIGLVTGALADYLRVTAAASNTVQVVGQHEKILRKLREELQQSSSNRSSQKQWWIEDAGKTLRFRKFTSFTLDADGDPIITWSSDIVYTLDANGFITRSEGGGAPVEIAGNVVELLFTELDNGRVGISLTNETGSTGRNTTAIISTAIEVTPQN
jgi:Tfp pilus assembly protein PilE